MKAATQLYTCKLFILLVFLCIGSCTKSVRTEQVNSETFLKVYEAPSNQSCTFIKQTPDGGFIIIGTDSDNATLLVLKTDKHGALQWKKPFTGLDLNSPLINVLKNGNILITRGNNGGLLCCMNQNGDILFETEYSGLRINSIAVQCLNGSFVTASGWSTYSYNYSTLFNFDPSGLYNGSFRIYDASFETGLKVLSLGIYKCDTLGKYFFYGNCYRNWNGNPRNQKNKVFLSKQTYAGNNVVHNEFLVIDENDPYADCYTSFVKENPGKGALVLISSNDINWVAHTKLIKVDDNLNILWETKLNVTTLETIGYDFTTCADGGTIISGTCRIDKKRGLQPFACKIGDDGKIIWSKIYETAFSGSLNYGFQVDNHYYFTGKSNGFGNGYAGDDIFMIKTDFEGNLK